MKGRISALSRRDAEKKAQAALQSEQLNSSKKPLTDASLQDLISTNRELRRRAYKLYNLVEASFLLNSTLDEPRIIQSYLLNLFGLVNTENIVILLSDSPYKKEFKPYHHQGIPTSNVETLTVAKDDLFLKFFDKERDVFIVEQYRKDGIVPYVNKLKKSGIQMVAPIFHRNAMLGLAAVGKRYKGQKYSELEIEIFSLLTNFLAVALANAKLYKEMERVSLTDPLTGLYNRRYFENNLKSEVARAHRFNHPLSLVMLDVDHFKNYNDRLGHTNGDLLLKKLAHVLSKTIRTCDTIARYGGEEFCVILPEIGKEGAIKFTRRLRDIINHHPFDRRDIQPHGCITVSMGIATCPQDASRVNELVDRADSAMYSAKKHGRNRVAIYQTDSDTMLN